MTAMQTQPMRTVSPWELPRASEGSVSAAGGTHVMRAECPTCGKVFCRALLLGQYECYVQDKAGWRRLRPGEGTVLPVATARHRLIFCDHCPRIVMALFAPDSSTPLPRSVVHIIDASNIDRLLRLHPDLAGVEQC